MAAATLRRPLCQLLRQRQQVRRCGVRVCLQLCGAQSPTTIDLVFSQWCRGSRPRCAPLSLARFTFFEALSSAILVFPPFSSLVVAAVAFSFRFAGNDS